MNVLIAPRLSRDRSLSRFLSFGLVVVLAMSGLVARLFWMQIAQGGHYAGISALQSTVQVAVPSSRGLIYDRAGRPLVTNVPSYSVKVTPAELPLSERPTVVSQLSSLLGLDETQINLAIDSGSTSNFEPVRIAQDVPEATARIIAEEHLALPGVSVVVEARRDYTTGSLLSQIIGYTGAISADQYKTLKAQGYQIDDMIGEAGVEATYEQQLRGTYGQQTVLRDATGQQLQVLSTDKAAQPGDSLRLTIDQHEQQLAQQALQWGLTTAHVTQGVIIVENPQTGEILAMVSLPTYDDNEFATGITAKEFNSLITNPGKPLINKAISEQYAPGSTYKLVTGTGALSDGRITPSTLIESKPYVQLGSYKYWEWNHAGWGPLTIITGLAHSSDTFFYQVAELVGLDRLAYWAKQYGFGAPTGIDLPNEASGIVPDNQWKIDTLGQPMYPGEVIQSGIGQGYDAATPLQVLNAYSTLANGGKLMQPQVVREVVGPDGSVVRPFTPIVIRKIAAPATALTTMRLATRAVITSRHTYNMVDMPIVVAGKTGTAEFGIPDKYGRLPYHQWFVGYVPAHGDVTKPDSQLAVIAFVYGADTLGDTATEIVKYYLQLHFGLKGDWRLPQLLITSNFYGDANNH